MGTEWNRSLGALSCSVVAELALGTTRAVEEHSAGSSRSSPPKRPGLPFQQLRASAALAIEWFRICKRYGWLGSARRRDFGELRKVDGMKRLRSVLRARKMRGLALPYGPAAVKLGLARAGPSP